MEQEVILSMQHIEKVFPGVKALDDVNISLHRGEILGICGENGAGKSTLLKILSGIYIADGGTVVFDQKTRHFQSPKEAIKEGISVIHQELSYLDELSVAENIYQGRLPIRYGLVNWKQLFQDADALLKKYEIPIDAKVLMKELPMASKQLVEIVKAISINAKIVVMDEPTSSLGLEDVAKLMKIVRSVVKDQVSFIFVSHRLEELFEICNRIVVLRDGRTVAEYCGEFEQMEVVSSMVGRQLTQLYNKNEIPAGEEIFRMENLCTNSLNNISLHVRSGEILGLYGMAGAGQDDILDVIFGMKRISSGNMFLEGKKLTVKNPSDAIRNGIAYVTAERKTSGLILMHSVERNLTLTSFKKLSRSVFVSRKKEKKIAEKWIPGLRIKTPTKDTEVGTLSGGNQQKVVMGKWLELAPKLLLLNEPTRGVDVGARREIFEFIQQQCAQGMAVIMISSDMMEMLNLADRIHTVFDGRITAEFAQKEANSVNLMLASIDQYEGGQT